MKTLRIVVALLIVATLSSAAQTTKPSVSAVVRIGMTVEDMDRSVAFFSTVLDFRKISDVEIAGEQYERLFGVFGMRARVVRLGLGEETIDLTQYLTPRGRVVPRDSRSNDRWFQHIAIVTTDMDRAYQRLREKKVGYASTGPQTLPAWNRNAGGIRAFYFRDPDDHVLEVIWFPAGKGDAKWQAAKGLFAGIDHTAVVVSDTAKSLALYRDVLGMRVAGESENYGTEQEHLNNVEGARLRITLLRASKGPGMEFLEYLNPRDGRAAPADTKSNDLLHWQTTVLADDPAGTLKLLRMKHLIGSTDSVVALSESTLGFGRAFLVQDPDGHIIIVSDAHE